MSKLNDLLAGETADQQRATQGALLGRSPTGFSGKHTIIDPLAGRLVDPDRRVAAGTDDRPEPPGRRNAVDVEMEEGDRQPFGLDEQPMARPKRPGYRRYWFNDVPGRIARAKKAGYVHAIDPDTGEPDQLVTDKAEGRGRKSYLMEIPMAWYQKDQAANAEKLAARLRDIREGRAGPGADDNRYIPKQGITITGR